MGKEGENNVTKSYQDDEYDPSFKTYVWNPKTGQFLGRNGLSWIKLTVFYTIFYIALAAFFVSYYYLFSLTLSPERPKWILGSSLIGTNPGLGYRPKPNPEDNADSTLIWYKRGVTSDEEFWYKQLSEYIDEVEKPGDHEDIANCNYNGTKATETRSCRVDPRLIDRTACTKANRFGYPTGEPCILLKLNRIFGWEPEGYGIKDGKYDRQVLEDELKEAGMPNSLQKFVLDRARDTPTAEILGFLNTVWISCEGEGTTDKEAIGNIAYHPQPGIPGYYFPYYQQKGYKSPFIFIQLTRPTYLTLINIECKAWAKNIIPDRTNRLGSVHFEVLID